MPKITYITADDQQFVVQAASGTNAMESAIKNSVPGIEAECGGACACATCQVYVDEAWREKTGQPASMEQDMLEFAWEPQEGSRLSCQIRITDDLDGLVLHIPKQQS